MAIIVPTCRSGEKKHKADNSLAYFKKAVKLSEIKK